MQTVNDFRSLFFQRAGVINHADFTRRSAQHVQFWNKLNSIGARRIRELPPETVPDIDETVILSDKEWRELEQELGELL